MEQAVFYFGNDGLRMPTGGCSAVMSGGVYGRNYDFRPRGYEGRVALVQTRGSYASIGASQVDWAARRYERARLASACIS
jgi:hypothetical protein